MYLYRHTLLESPPWLERTCAKRQKLDEQVLERRHLVTRYFTTASWSGATRVMDKDKGQTLHGRVKRGKRWWGALTRAFLNCQLVFYLIFLSPRTHWIVPVRVPTNIHFQAPKSTKQSRKFTSAISLLPTAGWTEPSRPCWEYLSYISGETVLLKMYNVERRERGSSPQDFFDISNLFLFSLRRHFCIRYSRMRRVWGISTR